MHLHVFLTCHKPKCVIINSQYPIACRIRRVTVRSQARPPACWTTWQLHTFLPRSGWHVGTVEMYLWGLRVSDCNIYSHSFHSCGCSFVCTCFLNPKTLCRVPMLTQILVYNTSTHVLVRPGWTHGFRELYVCSSIAEVHGVDVLQRGSEAPSGLMPVLNDCDPCCAAL